MLAHIRVGFQVQIQSEVPDNFQGLRQVQIMNEPSLDSGKILGEIKGEVLPQLN